MNEEKEDPILAAPCPVKEESAAPAMDTTHVDPASDDKDKSRLNYDQRRISLLNNPDYGVVLSFLDKFRSYVDVQEYPLHLLEENLLSHEETSTYPSICLPVSRHARGHLSSQSTSDRFPHHAAKTNLTRQRRTTGEIRPDHHQSKNHGRQDDRSF